MFQSYQSLELNSIGHAVIDQLPHCVFWKNVDSVFLGCNELFAKRSGFPSSEAVVGKTDYDMPWKAYAALYVQDDQGVMHSGEGKLEFEEEHINHLGETVVVLVSKVPLYTDNQLVGVLGIYTDITERKRMERQLLKAKKAAEAANLAKTEFLENMRHDIRTPLSGIVSLALMLQKQSDKPILKTLSDKLLDSSYAFLRLVDEIFEAVNFPTGKIQRLDKRFSLKETIQLALHVHQPTATSKQLSLLLDYDESIPSPVIGDALRIKRIILELMTNALKYTDQGHVKLIAHLSQQKLQQIVVKISVEDTGLGIPTDKHQIIFNRFTRLMPSFHGTHSGMGLGLANVLALVKELKGEIEVSSQPRAGSTFSFSIPLELPLSSVYA